MEQQILVGFHAVIARIRQAPETLKTVYFDPSRRDRRMKEFIEVTQETIGRKIHQADSERLRQLAGHDRHQGGVAFAEPASLARNVAELLVKWPVVLLKRCHLSRSPIWHDRCASYKKLGFGLWVPPIMHQRAFMILT